MSSRRPRIKPIANLTARRVKSERNTVENSSEEAVTVEVEEHNSQNNLVKENVEIITVENRAADKKYDETQTMNEEIEKNILSPQQKYSQPTIMPTKTNRRRIKPTITLPQRKPKVIPMEVEKADDIANNSVKCDVMVTVPESVAAEGEIQHREPFISKFFDNLKPTNNSSKIANFEEPIDDSVFKSPQSFLSPRYNPPTPKTNPFGSEISPIMLSTNELMPKDDLKCPLSPTKIRQRIKVVPMLGNRRNSIQGRDECDEIPRRQRHLSSSSSHSNQNLSLNYKTMSSPGYPYSNRIRTESSCSNASDISVVRDVAHKNRRVNRSEEQHRLNEAKRGFKERFQNSVPDKSQLKMYDMIFYNPSSNPMKSAVTIKEDRRGSSSASSISSFVGKREPSLVDPMPKLPIKSKSEENAMPVPQLKIGPNGDIIIDEKSLVIETTSEKTARETLANSDIVYDDEFSGTQGFYKRQLRMRDWGRTETIKFYRCLQTIGTDFSMMIQLFPKRNRRELKLKFKKEEKTNPVLINKALLCPKTFNIEELEEDFKRDEEMERLNGEKAQQKRVQNLKDLKKKYYDNRTIKSLQKGANENLPSTKITKNRQRRNKNNEKRTENDVLNERKTVMVSEVSSGKNITMENYRDANCEHEDYELNNNNDENTYTPNLNILESIPQHGVSLIAAEVMEYDNSSNVLTNGNGFTTLVNNCGKSYFSSDMTTKSSAKQEMGKSEDSASVVETMQEDSDDDGLVIDSDFNESDEADIHHYNDYKTDMLFNETQKKPDLDSVSESGTSEYDNEFLNRLVAVEIEDSADSTNRQYQFFTINPETGDLSEKPLDLPPDIVETIITNCCKK